MTPFRQYRGVYPDGPPALYKVDEAGRLVDPLVRPVFCCDECRGAYAAKAPPGWSRQNAPWGFIEKGTNCAECERVLWHAYLPASEP